jgi:hypothetical protein
MDMNDTFVVHQLDLLGYPRPTNIALYSLKKHGISWEKKVEAELEWR